MNYKIPKIEQTYPIKHQIDTLDLSKSFNLMINDQAKVIEVIKKNKKNILIIINFLISHLSKFEDARLVYCGAGTSGRIGMQDCVELYPTFGWPINRSFCILAGGKEALTRSIENSEDDFQNAQMVAESSNFTKNDLVIGLAASGNTIFTREVLKIAKKKGALTIAISNNPKGDILKEATSQIILDTKQEVIAGSTRLKAGTAQKVCLNLISSMLMIKLGKVKDGQMINMIPTNKKLKKRKLRINKYFKDKINQ